MMAQKKKKKKMNDNVPSHFDVSFQISVEIEQLWDILSTVSHDRV